MFACGTCNLKSWALESVIQLKEFRIPLTIGIRMTRNPESSNCNPESTAWSPESKTVLYPPYIGDLDHYMFLGDCPPTPPLSQH